MIKSMIAVSARVVFTRMLIPILLSMTRSTTVYGHGQRAMWLYAEQNKPNGYRGTNRRAIRSNPSSELAAMALEHCRRGLDEVRVA